jgi:hypothetical protein
MKPGRGARKGGSFERLVARTLSLWLTGGRSKTQLVRSIMSGGWRKGAEDAWRHMGDLAPNGPEGDEFRRVFAIECKHHRTVDWWDLWKKPKGTKHFMAWWRKLNREIQGTPLQPLLVFRANRCPIMVAFSSSYAILGAVPTRRAHLPAHGLIITSLADLVTQDPRVLLAAAMKDSPEE